MMIRSSSLCILSLLVFNQINAGNVTPPTKDNYYLLRGNFGYDRNSTIDQLEDVTLVNCLMRCGTAKGCKHVAFNNKMNHCKMLERVVKLENGYTTTDDTKIYSLGE